MLFADDCDMPSKMAIDPEEPSVGCIRTDSIAPPHTPTSILQCISRVEKTPAFGFADLFADISCDTPLTESHISFLRNDGPGQTLDKPIAIVQKNKPIAIVQKAPFIPEGKYAIKNRARSLFWNGVSTLPTVHFYERTDEQMRSNPQEHVSLHAPVSRLIKE
jgi:hypothetical protein